MTRHDITDADWASLRAAAPTFASAWREYVQDTCYNAAAAYLNTGAMAEFVACEMLVQQPDLVPAIGEELERLFVIAALADDELLEGVLRVGFLEELLSVAIREGIPLTRLQPILVGPRTRAQWTRAIAWLRPGFEWEEGVGLVPSISLPALVGTIEVHRGRTDVANGVCRLDVRLISGEVHIGDCIRRARAELTPHGWPVIARVLRNVEVPDEYELTVSVERAEAFQGFEYEMGQLQWGDSVWQVARPDHCVLPPKTTRPDR